MAADSDLTSFTVSLPRAQKDYLQHQAIETGCSTPSEYIRRLLHADQRVRAQEQLEKQLLEGLTSPAKQMTSEDWVDLKKQVAVRIAARKKTSSRRKKP